MAEHRVPTKVFVNEEEYLRLVNLSSDKQVVHARFGGNRVWLDEIPANAWAFALLVEWRGLNT